MKFLFSVLLTMLFSVVYTQPYLVGDRVDIHAADGKYYGATVLNTLNDQLKIRYLGMGTEQDVLVAADNAVRGGAKGDKIIVVAASGTFYGIIEDVLLNSYKVKYDGYAENYTLTRSQFNFMTSVVESRKNNALNAVSVTKSTLQAKPTEPIAVATNRGTYAPGTKLLGLEGKTWYAATIKEYTNGKYLVKWDDYTTEAWLSNEELKLKPTLPADKARMANGKIYLRSMRWIATGNTELSWFFLGDNGVIIINPIFGTNPTNCSLEQVENFKNVGVYALGTNTLNVKWLNGQTTAYSMVTKNGEIIELDAGGIMVRQKGLPDNYTLSGTYKGSISFAKVSRSASYTFSKDGTVSVDAAGTAGQGRAETNRQGRYQIKGCNLLITFNDGTKTTANIGTANGSVNSNIIINSTWLTKM